MNSTRFKEIQRFDQWWVWLILGTIAIIPIYSIFEQLLMGRPFGDRPMSNFGVVIFSIFVFGLVYLFRYMKLETTIDVDGIDMNFIPFSHKSIRWNEIETAEIVNYGFVGGWGIRYGTKFGTVYNTKGKLGLALLLKDGTKLCIGTQKADELTIVINSFMHK